MLNKTPPDIAIYLTVGKFDMRRKSIYEEPLWPAAGSRKDIRAHLNWGTDTGWYSHRRRNWPLSKGEICIISKVIDGRIIEVYGDEDGVNGLDESAYALKY